MTSFTDRFGKLSFPTHGLVRLPQVSTDSPRANKDFLRHLVWDGYLAKEKKGIFIGLSRDTVIERLKMEFSVFERTGIIDYILLVWDFLAWCDKNAIPRGPGRGSVNGSLACFCCDIVQVNPLRHNLNFTRFISEARARPKTIDGILYAVGKNLCDIDCDISYSQRTKLLDYIEGKYPGRTAKISNRIELTGKTALKDVLKVRFGYSDEEAMSVTGHIEAIFGKVESLEEAYERHKDFAAWVEAEPEHKRAFELAKQIAGAPVAHGVHASGVYIGYYPIDGHVPIELSKKGETVTSYEMTTIADIGAKVDFLGLKTVDVIDETCKLVGIKVGDIDVNDPSIYAFLGSSSLYYGLFQIEDGLTKEAIKKVGPRHIDDLAACLAGSRPGALKQLPAFVEYVKTGKQKAIFPVLDAILKPTGGIILYQETINDVCQQMYGLSAVEADDVRRAISKKIREDMAKWEPILFANGKERGIPETVTDYFWKTCNASADYLFSANHCYAYSYITAQTTYLKAKYPKEFMLSLFRMARHETDSQGCLSTIMSEARQMGIVVLPPDIVKSSDSFTIDADGHIRFGLADIKGISDTTMQKLVSFRRDFKSKFEIFECAAASKVNIGILTFLIYAGTIDPKGATRSKLAFEAQAYNQLTDREKVLVHKLAPECDEDILKIFDLLKTRTDEKGKPLIKESRLATLRRDIKPYWEMYQTNSANEDVAAYIWERSLLGFSYSNTLHGVFANRIVGLKTIAEVLAMPPVKDGKREENVRIVCFVESIKRSISRKDSKTPYLNVYVTDDTAKVKSLLYGFDRIEGCKQANGGLPKEGDLLTITANRAKDGGMLWLESVTIQPPPVAMKKVKDSV